MITIPILIVSLFLFLNFIPVPTQNFTRMIFLILMMHEIQIPSSIAKKKTKLTQVIFYIQYIQYVRKEPKPASTVSTLIWQKSNHSPEMFGRPIKSPPSTLTPIYPYLFDLNPIPQLSIHTHIPIPMPILNVNNFL